MTDKFFRSSRLTSSIALAGSYAFALYTLCLISRMLWLLYYSTNSVMRADELSMISELRRFHEGKSGLGYLWAPYWGHRIVIPRLFFMADEYLCHLSDAPLVLVNVIAQCSSVALLIVAEWRLLRTVPRWIAMFAMSATAHLALSSLQLENFSYGMAVQYTVGMLSALASLTLGARALKDDRISSPVLLGALACALIAALSLASGPLVFPTLFLLFFGLRAPRVVLVFTLAIGIAFGAVYMWGYTNSAYGITFLEAFRIPIATVKIASLFLAGPISNQNVKAGECFGFVGMLLLIPTLRRLAAKRISRDEGVLAGFCLFLVFTSFSVAFARISPEWFGAHESAIILPSRYMAVPLLYWGAAFALVLHVQQRWSSYVIRPLAAGMVGCLTLHTVPSQLDVSLAWTEYHQKMDVAAAGLVVGVVDRRFMYTLLPDQERLDDIKPYMQDHGLSFFGDKWAFWMGRSLRNVFSVVPYGCNGTVSKVTPLEHGGLRLDGILGASAVPFPLERHIVVTNAEGEIKGLGFSLVQQKPNGSTKFVAYVREQHSFGLIAYLIRGRVACRLSS